MYRENKKRFKETRVSVDAGLEGLKVISCWEYGRRKRVPVSRCHRNKRIGECARSIGIQFKCVGVLNLRKSRISRKRSVYYF